MRVLSIPGRAQANQYFELLISELEKEGVRVEFGHGTEPSVTAL